MDLALWAALGGLAALLLVLLGTGLGVLLAVRRHRAERRDARTEVEDLRARVEELSTELAGARGAAVLPRESEYLITTAVDAPATDSLEDLSGRTVLSVTLAEPLVKAAAFGYGLRRAASAESRNRIAFAMRREVRRARKERRRAARRSRLHEARTEGAA